MSARWRDYLQAAKPGIIAGNLMTAAGGYLLAARGGPAGLAALLAGTGLVIASGCVFNNCIDHRIDRRMVRTRGRPLAAGRMRLSAAAVYGAVLGAAGMLLLTSLQSGAVAATVAGGWAVYVAVYTWLLKPRTMHAPLVGGLAGAAPPVAGYLAGGGAFDAGAALLAAMFLCWQMPHFYAIAIYRLDDYRAAGIPVLPLRRGVRAARRHGALYACGFFAAAFLLSAWGYAGRGYLAAVSALALLWLVLALVPAGGYRAAARRLFICSIVSIAVLTLMMGLNATGPGRVQTPMIDASLSSAAAGGVNHHH